MKCFLFTCSLFITVLSAAQAISVDTSVVCGIWKGTSLCQVKPSPCNDEVVVYYIKAGAKENEFTIIMNKIVSGKEEDMAVIPATFDLKTQRLTGIMKGYAAWNFTVKDKIIEGTLLLPDGTVYRLIHVEKQ